MTLAATSAAPSSLGLPAQAGGDPVLVDPSLAVPAAAGTARLPATSPATLRQAAKETISLMSSPFPMMLLAPPIVWLGCRNGNSHSHGRAALVRLGRTPAPASVPGPGAAGRSAFGTESADVHAPSKAGS